ncbi:hypothetical protein BJ138DRAFT_1064691 [Hygrophoropsis aurantiaca]|uniref:Uncharacterized protein n=1 Tax=Hygrophoropsis aurantiaca TaxID=72124 RepID=A0ACB8ACC3_9AGAM|nr:hypothetical protein BJ138DRAFT_1064691 [Hygrophoropsis aurantiaca]
MTALPALPDRFLISRTLHGAYTKCLSREKSLQGAPDSKERQQKLINVRIVGFIVLDWPTPAVVQTIAREVAACKEDAIDAIGQRYYNHLLRSLKSNGGPIPDPSAHISRPSFDRKMDLIKEMLVEAPQDHQATKKKASVSCRALIRDGFRCIVTGRYDTDMGAKTEELRDEIMASGKETVATQCAHIFSGSTDVDIAGPDTDDEQAASVWAVMKGFGGRTLPDDLNGHKIHRLENVMTMSYDVHQKFGKLNVWFMETDTPNKYELCAPHGYYLTGYPKTVTFENHSDLDLPLPSPTYLKIHAAYARVAHHSGAAEQIDKVLGEMEDIQILSEDGTSAEVLNHAILALKCRYLKMRSRRTTSDVGFPYTMLYMRLWTISERGMAAFAERYISPARSMYQSSVMMKDHEEAIEQQLSSLNFNSFGDMINHAAVKTRWTTPVRSSPSFMGPLIAISPARFLDVISSAPCTTLYASERAATPTICTAYLCGAQG